MARLEPEEVEKLAVSIADSADEARRRSGVCRRDNLESLAEEWDVEAVVCDQCAAELRAGLPALRREAALDRAVRESAARGECVLVDGRGSVTRIEHWGPAEGLEQAAEGHTLADALDALAEQQEASDREQG